MKLWIGAMAMTLAFGIAAPHDAAAAPQRWQFDVIHPQTGAVVGTAGVVGQTNEKSLPASAYYSLQFSTKLLPAGNYRIRLEINGVQAVVDFSPESTGDVQLRVSPVLALQATTSVVPSINVYLGDALTYRGALRRGDSASGPAEGMGTLSGQCGVMNSAVITASTPSLFRNALDFLGDAYDASDFTRLSADAQTILGSPTPTTSAVLARAFAFEVLRRCEGARLLKSAEEIQYVDAGGKKAHMLIDIGGRWVGVTSTRAVGYPLDSPFSVDQARTLLERSLSDVLLANQNVAATDRWTKQVLHVFAYGQDHAASLEAAYIGLDATLKANTILLITVSDGADAPLYQ